MSSSSSSTGENKHNTTDTEPEPIEEEFRKTAQEAYSRLLDICRLLCGLSGMNCPELQGILEWGNHRYSPWLSSLDPDGGICKNRLEQYMTPSDNDFRLMLNYVPQLIVHVPKHLKAKGFPDISLDKSTLRGVAQEARKKPWTWDETEDCEQKGWRFVVWFKLFIDALNNFIEDAKEEIGLPPEFDRLLPKEVTEWAEAQIGSQKKEDLLQ